MRMSPSFPKLPYLPVTLLHIDPPQEQQSKKKHRIIQLYGINM
jgi:hypothetical protein